jgi:uncharacterized protein
MRINIPASAIRPDGGQMTFEEYPLGGDSPGTRRVVALYRFGTKDARPKVYIQAALHADEMPGVIVIQHLLPLLDAAEAAGQIKGEIVVVPVANPIGLAQWVDHKPLGRFEAESMENFNRHYPDVGPAVIDAVRGRLGQDVAANAALIRAEMVKALDALATPSDLMELRVTLMRQSLDADYVLDLHCDHVACFHHYASTIRPETSELLGRCLGSKLALICEVSGGNAFDEAHTAPWAALRHTYGDVVPAAVFATTIEYRGQLDVDDATAAEDAANLITFLALEGVVNQPGAAARHPSATAYPLEGSLEVFAPFGGVVTWSVAPGAWVKAGETLATVRDPVSRKVAAVTSPIDGMMFRRELWPSCLRGQGLAHVAGREKLRTGDLLSD